VVSAVVRPNALQRDKRAQALFAAVGHSLTDQPWWRGYQAHGQRRHNVIHRGARLTEKEAAASIDTMWALVKFMRRVRTSAGRA
jgi:hypothetical protein